jgi:hypothetical protein
MTAALLAAKRGLIDIRQLLGEHASWRALSPAALLALAVYDPAAGRVIVDTIAEAYLQVAAFVAATLAVIYGVERVFRFDLAETLHAHPRAQVPVAALLGALPGCGGAIVVVTQYVKGHVGFGALIAVLTATMGDAAFLLIAQAPRAALLIFGLGLGVGALCGVLVDAIHGPQFMRAQTVAGADEADNRAKAGKRAPRSPERFDPIWFALMVPAIVFALPIAAQMEPNTWFGPLTAYEPVTLLGFAGGMLALLMWVGHFTRDPGEHCATGAPGAVAANPNDTAGDRVSLRSRIVNDTNFVTVWVLAAFLLFELGMHFTGADLASWFGAWAALVPLIAVLVGFLPGCGPQIIVTSLYLTGVIPIGALLANAISNDGDALFPAIALAPKAAIVATLYTGIPALIVGYATLFLF